MLTTPSLLLRDPGTRMNAAAMSLSHEPGCHNLPATSKQLKTLVQPLSPSSPITLEVANVFQKQRSQHTMINPNSEGASCRWLPSILLIIIVLGDDHNFLSHKVSRVKPHTKLPNHGDVCTSLEKEMLTFTKGNSNVYTTPEYKHRFWHSHKSMFYHRKFSSATSYSKFGISK